MAAEPPAKRHQLDIRPLLARGEEPFSRISAMVVALGPHDELVIVSPFLPSPLIERLQEEDFEAQPERRADGSWSTVFRRK